MVTTAIWWIRRDLRLSDNQALTSALAQANQVLPTFILDPALLNSPYTSEKRLAFLLGGLRQLAADLAARGSRLLIRRGEPQQELARLLSESGAQTIFAEADFSPYARRRDQAVAAKLPLQRTGGVTVRPPGTVGKADGQPYVVFTPYSKKWKSLPLPDKSDLAPAPATIPTPTNLPSESLPDAPTLPTIPRFPPGEAEAQARLRRFVTGAPPPIFAYVDRRNRPDLDGTSQLSPYLRFGMLSARQAVVAALAALEAKASAASETARQSVETWLNELIWREFYLEILYHFPQVRQQSFRPELARIPWDNNEAAFQAWGEGRTGYPIVDAAMRQLRESGWMHNRSRMIAASFLVKDLLIDWRWGERWFMQHLIDGDPAANNGGWQWTAGTGTDAAPYFRIFNPTTQSKKFDPDGVYIRRWLPELTHVPDQFIHEPARMSEAAQRESNCIIGQDYPAPIVDHKAARERALAAYKEAKESGS